MMSLSGILNEYVKLKDRVRSPHMHRIRVGRTLTAPQPQQAVPPLRVWVRIDERAARWTEEL